MRTHIHTFADNKNSGDRFHRSEHPHTYVDTNFVNEPLETPTDDPSIARHIRDFSGEAIGVVNIGEATPLYDTPLPSMGEVVDDYFMTHGYLDNVIQETWRAFTLQRAWPDFREAMLSHASRSQKHNLEAIPNMVIVLTTKNLNIPSVGRHSAALQQILKTNKTQYPWRHRSNPSLTRRKLTPEERRILKEKRGERLNNYGKRMADIHDLIWKEAYVLHKEFLDHSVDYYYEDIMSKPKRAQKEQGVNPWNAYLRQQMKIVNDALLMGAPRHKATDPTVLGPIRERWNTMTVGERDTATVDVVQELKAHWEMKQVAQHQVPLASLGDSRRTLESIQKELAWLHECTGVEILLFAVHGNIKSYNRPFSYWSSERALAFVRSTYNTHCLDFAGQFEGYCISGAESIHCNYVAQLLELKARIAALILRKLSEVTGGRVTKMSYQAFNAITAKHGVVIHNWPLSVFQAPSNINLKNELKILHMSWETGATSFRQLSKDKYEQWRTQGDAGTVELEEQQGEQAAGTALAATPEVAGAIQITTTTMPTGNTLKRTTVTIGTTATGQPLTITKTVKATRKDKATAKEAQEERDGGHTNTVSCKFHTDALVYGTLPALSVVHADRPKSTMLGRRCLGVV
ncbi:hypothetical protein EW026_g5440 [Hermanssonia centrifuga]|uniref:Uncharacterized protein n=1 Tax=Hermanssonia centrifuga TaxID=98765 RepID=A0A4S4KF57_9APHY|nr:hypothetical protein EW026_g5440 [Hermanssonia centrifuga]